MVCLRTWHFLSGPVVRLLPRKLSQPQGTAKLMATNSRIRLHSPSALLLPPVAALMTLSPYGENCANSLTRFAVWLSLRLDLRALKKMAPGEYQCQCLSFNGGISTLARKEFPARIATRHQGPVAILQKYCAYTNIRGIRPHNERFLHIRNNKNRGRREKSLNFSQRLITSRSPLDLFWCSLTKQIRQRCRN
ncbi:hypothetical protein PoB_005936500 [Plakobranchus ocellatus]|uniref:Uncharacterized protein n=1 Tax=Plakobranchus ocellatus TaxID=259542 RepID=A0AAV4CJ15_9GAST|nr:hypothetical protein PoB_005936500 [Plakobranchus ocellatus]